MSKVYDVVIVGAGAIGCSIARELSRNHISILLLERSTDVSMGASKSNSGIIHGGYDAKFGSLKSKVCRLGNEMYDRLNEELNFGFSRIGSLVLAFSENDVRKLVKLKENGRKNGVKELFIINREDVLKMEPHVNPEVVAALYCPRAGICSPYEYVIALAENAMTNGAEIKLQHEVLDILRVADEEGCDSNSRSKEHFLIRTSGGESFRAKVVVNAAGLLADRLASMVGASSFTIVPRKGEYILLDRGKHLTRWLAVVVLTRVVFLAQTKAHEINHVLFPCPQKERGKGILVSPTLWGNLLLGPTSRGGSEPMTQKEILELIIRSAKTTIPLLDTTKFITSYTGLRAKSDRGDFIIEESRVENFINVAGIDSPGLTSSPAVGKMVSEIVVNCLERSNGLKVSPNPSFNAFRKAIIVKKDSSFQGTIDDEDPNKNIICRCEKVTQAEIEECISHRPLPATTTDMVKRRTRAGMGKCQGTFCEARVAALIAKERNIPIEQVGRHSAGSSVMSHRRITAEEKEILEKISKL